MLQLTNRDIYATVEKQEKETKYNNKQSWRLEEESDAAKLISDDSSSDAEDILTLTINQATKFGKLKKPVFSLFDVIIFSVSWDYKTKYLGNDFLGAIFKIVASLE